MSFETSFVYLEKTPKIVVDSGFDWATFWSFSATVAIFVLGTYLTIRSFNKNIISQEKVAKENFDLQKILISGQESSANRSFELQREMMASQELIASQASLKASRQSWINDLRDTTAQFISSAMNISRLRDHEKSTISSINMVDPSVKSEIKSFHESWAASHLQSIKEVVVLKYKIELLLNPEEVDSKEFIKAVNELFDNCDQAGGQAKKLSVQVVWWCQHILKQEWEKAKVGK